MFLREYTAYIYIYKHSTIYTHIALYIVKLATIVEGNPKAPFSIATTPRCREGVAPSPTPWCSSYRKGSLQVTLDYGRQLYFYLYIYIYTHTLKTLEISLYHIYIFNII